MTDALRPPARKATWPCAAAAGALLSLGHASVAEAGKWWATGDLSARDDLVRLVDEGVINLPLLAWPVHSDAVRGALDAIPAERALTSAQRAAVERLRTMLGRDAERRYALSAAEQPYPARGFADEPREEGEVGVVMDFVGDAWSARLDLTLAADPFDDQVLRPDGSYVERRFGNWSVTAGWLERWWGPGWEGSALLGTAARPVPALSLDRALSPPFETKWLSWLGPWTVNAFIGLMEMEREDRDHPLLMGLRVAARPVKGLEIALERTAQWCAEGLPCDLDAFWNVMFGRDNEGENVAADDEPGNQLAGWSIRWASPFEGFPVALYGQTTGEAFGKDTIPTPVQRLWVRGVEVWGGRESRWPWRAHFEVADTTCSVEGSEVPDCAYNNGLFFVEGYRFRGRPVGHGIDGDGYLQSFGLMVQGDRGSMWQLLLRRAEINRVGFVPDTRHSLSPLPVDVDGGELRVDFDWLGARWAAGIGVDRLDRAEGRDSTRGRGFLSFERPF